MVFNYPAQPHVRKHGPVGYTEYSSYKPWLRDEFIFRCSYCLIREVWYPNVSASFGVDHFTPQILAPELTCTYDNLVYACNRCNSWKQDNVVLDPCKVDFSQHLQVNEDGTIQALTQEAVEHMQVLGLDDPDLTRYRKQIIDILKRLQALPDETATDILHQWLRFPNDLPNLNRLRPPNGNSRPEGVSECFYNQKQAGRLPKLHW